MHFPGQPNCVVFVDVILHGFLASVPSSEQRHCTLSQRMSGGHTAWENTGNAYNEDDASLGGNGQIC